METSTPRRDAMKQVALWIAGAIAALFLALYLFLPNEGPYPNDSAARNVCRKFLAPKLSEPANAVYSNTRILRTGNGLVWQVEGHVDEPNVTTAGYPVRLKYSCLVEYIGNENWQALRVLTEHRGVD
jgi:hypothetical protein